MPQLFSLLSKRLFKVINYPLVIAFCGLGIVTLALLMGCGSPLRHPGQVTITFSTWGSAEELAIVKRAIKAFESEHPTIHVKLLHIPENYFQKLHILVASGLTPDVAFVNSLSYSVYAQNDIFQPLDTFLAPATGLDRRVFFSSALQAFTWKGHLYAIPRDVSNLVMYYNQDLFEQAGVPLPSPGWTLETMRIMAQKLTRDHDQDGVNDQFGVSFFTKPPLLWMPFVWSAGGSLFDQDFTRFLLAQPEAVSAIQFYSDLRNKWHVAPTRKEVGSANMSELFLQGKLAMLLSGRWSVPVFREQAKFRWNVAPFPSGQAGSVVGIDASGYAISRQSRHPQESWALVAYLSSPEVQRAFAEGGLIVPARRDVAESSVFLKSPPQGGHYFLDVTASGQPSHTPERWNEISEELGLALEPVWEGRKTAKQAIQDVTPKIEKMLR